MHEIRKYIKEYQPRSELVERLSKNIYNGQLKLLKLLARGFTDKEICAELGYPQSTLSKKKKELFIEVTKLEKPYS